MNAAYTPGDSFTTPPHAGTPIVQYHPRCLAQGASTVMAPQRRPPDNTPFHAIDTTAFALLILIIGVIWPASPSLFARTLAGGPQPDPRERATPSRMNELAAGQTEVALDLYARLKEDGKNLLLSPASISTALAMTTAGAQGETARQLRQALRFSSPPDEIHRAHAELTRQLAENRDDDKTQVRIANALWPHAKHAFRDEYLDVLQRYYRAQARPLDYEDAPESARQTINDWVKQQTADKITDLLPEGSIHPMTRMVLVNAIWFKGAWQHPFEASQTQSADFTIAPNRRVQVPMMRQTAMVNYAKTDGTQLVELPYADSDLAMLIILPPPDLTLDQFNAKLTADALHGWIQAMRPRDVNLQIPKFSISWGTTSLKSALHDMGVVDAFVPGTADFSGMDGTRSLLIDDVVHKAFIEVTEEGAEAAAATGVSMRAVSIPLQPENFRANRPFYFMIRDRKTMTPLFFGRLVNPQN